MSVPTTAAPRITVVIPTFERRDLAVAAVRSLARQRGSLDFEAIVVVDGSSDGSATALRALDVPFPLTVLEQPNRGAATARNAGAAGARGELLLFLDDDMESDPALLAEHDRLHREGADLVLGHIPLHPDSPPGFLSWAVGRWAENRLDRLSLPGAQLTLHDLAAGQMSLSREAFERVGGFDASFTREGSHGGEDIDFGYRLVRAGYRVVFSATAISRHRYVVTPEEHFRQYRQDGRADTELSRKHPEMAGEIARLNHVDTPGSRLVLAPLAATPVLGVAIGVPLRVLAVRLLRRGRKDRHTRRLFLVAKQLEYLRGVHESGGLHRPGAVVVLAYHAIADLDGDEVLRPYAVPPDRLAAQLETLARSGHRFLALDELLTGLEDPVALPERGVLLTFDDCTEDLLAVAAPLLARHGVPALAFAVSERLGGSNEWDRHLGAGTLRLLDAEGLRAVGASGIEIGAHSRTHPVLTRVPDEQLAGEVAGSAADLQAYDLPRPRAFAYPYGAEDHRVVAAARQAGFAVAFTTTPGAVGPDADRHRLPRVEVLRADRPWRLRLKLAVVLAPEPVRRLLDQLFRPTAGPRPTRLSALARHLTRGAATRTAGRPAAPGTPTGGHPPNGDGRRGPPATPASRHEDGARDSA